jgi:hypothetical protein
MEVDFIGAGLKTRCECPSIQCARWTERVIGEQSFMGSGQRANDNAPDATIPRETSTTWIDRPGIAKFLC